MEQQQTLQPQPTAAPEALKDEARYQRLIEEYREILTQKFRNSNTYIIEIKAAQAALKRMELERRGAPLDELRMILTEAKKDAVCTLMMELGDFLGDQQMVRAGKATRSFMQWGIKHIITKLTKLGLELTQKDIKELTVDVCLERIEKLKQKKAEIQSEIQMTAARMTAPRLVS